MCSSLIARREKNYIMSYTWYTNNWIFSFVTLAINVCNEGPRIVCNKGIRIMCNEGTRIACNEGTGIVCIDGTREINVCLISNSLFCMFLFSIHTLLKV